MKYKRFLVLMDDQYYPSAGMGSVVGSFDTLEEAVTIAKSREWPSSYSPESMDSFDYAEVFDCDLRETVFEAD